jgi:Vitamin K-dependent gamma-carboxylase
MTIDFNKIFFKKEPITCIALFRIGISIAALVNTLMAIGMWGIGYGPTSVVPVNIPQTINSFNLFYFLNGNTGSFVLLFTINILSIIAVGIGWRTRTFACISFVTICTINCVNPLFWSGGESLVVTGMLWVIFSPAGGALSLDRVLKKKALEKVGKKVGPPRMAWPIAQRFLQLQLIMVYWGGFYLKGVGDIWPDGTALYFTSRCSDLARHHFWFFDHLWSIQFMTYASLLLETFLATIILIPALRVPLVLSAIAFHLGIESTMTVGSFQYGMLAFLLAMPEPRQVEYIKSIFKPGGLNVLKSYFKGWYQFVATIVRKERDPIFKQRVAISLLLFTICTTIFLGSFPNRSDIRAKIDTPCIEILKFLNIENRWSMFCSRPPNGKKVTVIIKYHDGTRSAWEKNFKDGGWVDQLKTERLVNWGNWIVTNPKNINELTALVKSVDNQISPSNKIATGGEVWIEEEYPGDFKKKFIGVGATSLGPKTKIFEIKLNKNENRN